MDIAALQYEGKETLIAEEPIECDATRILFKESRSIDTSTDKLLHERMTITKINANSSKIKKGDKYLEITYADTSDGQLYAFRCNQKIHESCMKYKLYPIFFIALFAETI